ncbi:MAG: cytochrome C [Salinisphaeraceae bacterium]|nr:cytochrome C [Salinisphaeraceae bacterium]
MMQRLNQTLRLMTAGVGVFAASTAWAAGGSGGSEKPHDGQWLEKQTKVCASCHGDKGISQIPMNPILAGQYKGYLLHSLKAYRDGKRNNAIMAGQVKDMSDGQLKALAEYYSRQDGPLDLLKLD